MLYATCSSALVELAMAGIALSVYSVCEYVLWYVQFFLIAAAAAVGRRNSYSVWPVIELVLE